MIKPTDFEEYTQALLGIATFFRAAARATTGHGDAREDTPAIAYD